jgi:hypothetical protein
MSALRIENAYYLILALITAPDETYVIFLSGKLFQNILFNCEFETKIVLYHQKTNNDPAANEVSSCFSKTFVIHRCLRSESLFFDMRKMTYYTLQRQCINKHVLDPALTLIYGFYRGVSTLIVFVLED